MNWISLIMAIAAIVCWLMKKPVNYHLEVGLCLVTASWVIVLIWLAGNTIQIKA